MAAPATATPGGPELPGDDRHPSGDHHYRAMRSAGSTNVTYRLDAPSLRGVSSASSLFLCRNNPLQTLAARNHPGRPAVNNHQARTRAAGDARR
ncbi:MAG: hypothetical protein MZV64_34935 [Ignavibacteriales bacterium]|nr:hypothetical protein [Ignavibacteriales bacterium]